MINHLLLDVTSGTIDWSRGQLCTEANVPKRTLWVVREKDELKEVKSEKAN